MLNISKHITLFSPGFSPGIRPVLFIFNLLFHFYTAAQQNLVPNGSFEDTISCPMGTANFQSVAKWYSPTLASPDYYNSCDVNNGGGIPYNDWGFQYAQDGSAYAGLGWGWNLDLGDYREYIAVKLTEPLKANETYCFYAYISLLDSVGYASNNFGFSLTTFPVTDYTTELLLPVSATYHIDNVVLDNINWTLVETTFVAQGGEEYLTIGNFFDNNTTHYIELKKNSIAGETAYYYIDNVWVEKCKASINFPNVFTPNDDGVNDVYAPLIHGFLNYEWSIYNRWGNKVFTSSSSQNWDGKYQDKECLEGVYFYIFEYQDESSQQKTETGFIHLIR